MFTIKRTTSENTDFRYLTRLFDEYLIEIDGDEKDFFAQFNQIYIKNVIVFYENNTALGCGALLLAQNQCAALERWPFPQPDGVDAPISF